MKLLKPKQMAAILNIPPDKISMLARAIEESNVYTFQKTPLGSFLFQDKDIVLLREYEQIFRFFQKKKLAADMLKYKMEDILVEKKEPDWFKHLHNAVRK